MRAVPLTVLKGGINRQRTKGGARADTLYDLVNGHLTDAGTARARPGTVRVAQLDTSTKGLVSFNGELHTFSHQTVSVPPGYVLHVLSHPDGSDSEAVVALSQIHFAAPFLGHLYVVAEFEDGAVYHYWVVSSGTWEADTVYDAGEVVTPTTLNGFGYRAVRLNAPYPSWTPRTLREVNDIIEPTEYNGFYYTAVEVGGSAPASGLTEPVWPTEDGARVTEESDQEAPTPQSNLNDGPSSSPLPPDVSDRYLNPGFISN